MSETLPVRKKTVWLRINRRRVSRVVSRPLNSAHITDEDREAFITALKNCSATNSARPGLLLVGKILLGRARLEEEGLL